SFAIALVIPTLAFISLRRGWRSGVVCLVTFSLFGVFYLVSAQIGLQVPFSTYGSFFPNFAGLVSSQPFSSLVAGIFGNGASSSSNPIAPVFDYVPIYFALVGSLVIILGTEGKKLMSRSTLDSPVGDAAILAAVTGLGSWLVFGSTVTSIGAILIVVSITLGYRLFVPVLAAKPRPPDTATAIALFPSSAAKSAIEFDEKEGIITESNPAKSKTMRDYWERTKGVAEVKEELTKAVALPIKHKAEARRFGVKTSHGVLLYGPPGTGKTTLLRGLASMLDMRYVEVNPAQILSKWYGESERKTKEVFEEAEQNPPCILALDEVDSVGRRRDSYSMDDVTPKVLNIVLMEMDRISQGDIDVVVVGTTNKPDVLDEALLRPGRFDKVIYMGPPDERAREEIFRGYISGKEVVAKDIDFAKLAKLSERFTGADIEGLVNKVLAGAFYDKLKSKQEDALVTQEMFENAIRTTHASIDSSTLEEYERFRVEFQRERRIKKGWESEISDVRFEDIGDMEAEKQELREIFELPIQRPELFEELKMRPVKGVLLHGPPGCGKTLLAKALATEISANFFVVSGGEIAREGASNAATQIKDLFNLAKDNSPAIVFIDEVDQIAPDRSNPMGALYAPVTTQLLTELDGVKELKGVWVLAATNRPEVLDPALLRP
ncbi:MAG: AAA family ATPase, partial [Thaumarchaeota archaeon]|nr:AAA family ATPase [Nitrososphaerota archaeon]